MTTTIVSATTTDIPAILALLTEAGLPHDGLTDHLMTTLVAKQENKIVGSVALEIYSDKALLRSVTVAASLRGQGLGTRLVDAAL
ncbi:MAG: GNAT family N-acetyltransferase, partial [Chloroflexota bacterium]